MSKFGEKIRQLREKAKLMQKHVASRLDIDTPMLSKIERGDRMAKREQVLLFSKIFEVAEDELLTLWLADQVIDVIKDENMAFNAIKIAEKEISHTNKRNLSY